MVPVAVILASCCILGCFIRTPHNGDTLLVWRDQNEQATLSHLNTVRNPRPENFTSPLIRKYGLEDCSRCPSSRVIKRIRKHGHQLHATASMKKEASPFPSYKDLAPCMKKISSEIGSKRPCVIVAEPDPPPLHDLILSMERRRRTAA
jgi:hypothetical protein